MAVVANAALARATRSARTLNVFASPSAQARNVDPMDAVGAAVIVQSSTTNSLAVSTVPVTANPCARERSAERMAVVGAAAPALTEAPVKTARARAPSSVWTETRCSTQTAPPPRVEWGNRARSWDRLAVGGLRPVSRVADGDLFWELASSDPPIRALLASVNKLRMNGERG